ncbi:MAG: hypothetical protein MST03_01710 [Bacteroidales bacterium]|nr:hypothetical protein [Bacteroidales bacterium]
MKIEIDGKKLLLEKISKEAVRKAVRIPDVWIHYALHKTEYMGESMIIMESIVENNFTPMRLKHLSDAVSEAYGVPAVMYFQRLEYYQRQRLRERGLYFIIGNTYVSLPSLIINRKMIDKKPVHMLTPVAQYLLLYHLQVASLTNKTARELEQITPFLYTTLTRAINVLVELHLCEIKLDGARFKHLFFIDDKQALWELAKPYLINPISNVSYTDKLTIDYVWPIAGINALSHYSMLNPEQMQTYALTEAEAKQLQKSGAVDFNPIDGAYRLEKWLYPPIANDGYVDRLSLALTLKEDDDPRVEKEVKHIIKDALC